MSRFGDNGDILGRLDEIEKRISDLEHLFDSQTEKLERNNDQMHRLAGLLTALAERVANQERRLQNLE